MLSMILVVSGDPICSQIVPLTIAALEVVLADLKSGNDQDMRVTLPDGRGWLPFITIPHHTCVKIMKLFIYPDLELAKSE